jgi:phage gp36-like protein
MAYLTRDQINLYCKQQELPNNFNDNSLNEDAILSTVDVMQTEIDSYLRQGGYKLPITAGKESKMLFVIIPVYRYYITIQSGMQTEQISKDYEIALNKLKAIAKGELLLELEKVGSENPPESNGGGWLFIPTGRI